MTAPVCADELAKLYDAIVALSTGKAVVSISFGERSVSYSQQQLAGLQGLYRVWWRQCGTAAGLPDISTAGQVERGQPARYRGM